MVGYTGISFPFRIGNKNSVVLSSVTYEDIQHIKESLQQIILTRKGERVHEPEFGTDIDYLLFENIDDNYLAIIRHEIIEALRLWEPRVEVLDSDINVRVVGEKVFISIGFTVIDFGISSSVDIETGRY